MALRPVRRRFRILSMFSGGGGLDRAVEIASDEAVPLVFVEREAFAVRTLVEAMAKGALAQAPVWADATTFDARAFRGKVDLLTAGFPCQDISVAGRGAGLDGERSGLWSEVVRTLRDARPAFAFLENVAALTSRGLDRVLRDLAELGFDAEWSVLRASDVGAPHQRARIFILAWALPDAGGDGLREQPERRQQRPAERGHALPSPMCEGSSAVGQADSDSGRRAGQCAPHDLDRRDAPGHDADRRSAAVGNPEGQRRGEGGAGAVVRRRRDAARSDGEAVGDSPSVRRTLGLHQRGDAGEELEAAVRAGGELPLWPPGPGDHAGWQRYLDAGGPEPAVCRGSDELASRVDRLHMLGNGVCDAQGAAAFAALWHRAGLGG